MRERIKSYLVFTSFGYRLVMFVLMPLAMVGLEALFTNVFGGAAIVVVMVMLLSTEVFADNWFLGGIQEKDGAKIDYLKTSHKSMNVMRSALMLDLVRRFLAFTGIAAICYLMNEFLPGVGNMSIGEVAFAVLVNYGLSVAGTVVARFISYIWLNLAVAYVVATPALLAQILVWWIPVWVLNLLFGVFCVAACILAVKLAMWKVKGGYYDK